MGQVAGGRARLPGAGPGCRARLPGQVAGIDGAGQLIEGAGIEGQGPRTMRHAPRRTMRPGWGRRAGA